MTAPCSTGCGSCASCARCVTRRPPGPCAVPFNSTGRVAMALLPRHPLRTLGFGWVPGLQGHCPPTVPLPREVPWPPPGNSTQARQRWQSTGHTGLPGMACKALLAGQGYSAGHNLPQTSDDLSTEVRASMHIPQPRQAARHRATLCTNNRPICSSETGRPTPRTQVRVPRVLLTPFLFCYCVLAKWFFVPSKVCLPDCIKILERLTRRLQNS